MAFKNFSVSLRSAFFSLVGLFFLLFFGRLIYSYRYQTSDNAGFAGISSPAFSDQGSMRKNYASEKSLKEPVAAAPTNTQGASTQKYEKTATLNARTDDFERDETTLRQTSTAFGAIIQYEQRTGNPGHRNLHLQ